MMETPSSEERRLVHVVDPRTVVPSAAPIACACFEEIRSSFRLQSSTRHELVDSGDDADVVLAPIQSGGYGTTLEALRRSAAFKRYREKLLVYSTDDNQFPAVPGLYPSTVRPWTERAWTAPAHYLSSHIHQFRFKRGELGDKDIAFSFVGSSRTHPVRSRILKLSAPTAILFDASKPNEAFWWNKPDAPDFVDRYRDVLLRTRFAICPRGLSPSSIRLFESMEAGCVPVIVSDDLQLPAGPAWERFSVVVREEDVERIPGLVDRLEPRAAEMGTLARAAWERFFAPDASASSLVRWATELLRRRARRSYALDSSFARLREYSSWSLFKNKTRAQLARLR